MLHALVVQSTCLHENDEYEGKGTLFRGTGYTSIDYKNLVRN